MILDYTQDRYTALMLVNRNLISADAAMLHRRDGRDLEPGVFAALVVLNAGGYLDQRRPQPGERQARAWPVQLSLTGMQLLARFNLERSRHAQPVG